MESAISAGIAACRMEKSNALAVTEVNTKKPMLGQNSHKMCSLTQILNPLSMIKLIIITNSIESSAVTKGE